MGGSNLGVSRYPTPTSVPCRMLTKSRVQVQRGDRLLTKEEEKSLPVEQAPGSAVLDVRKLSISSSRETHPGSHSKSLP